MIGLLRSDPFIRTIFWLIGLIVVVGALALDVKYGGAPMDRSGQLSGTMVMPNASSPT